MKPGLTTPRFFPSDAIDAEKIDEQIKLMAEQVNGGLSAHNLAPSYKILTSAFAENANIFYMTAHFDELSISQVPCGVLQGAARLIGASWALLINETTFARTVDIDVDGTLRWRIGNNDVPPGRTRTMTITMGGVAGPKTLLYGYEYADYKTTFANGSVFSVTYAKPASESFRRGSVTLMFSMDLTA